MIKLLKKIFTTKPFFDNNLGEIRTKTKIVEEKPELARETQKAQGFTKVQLDIWRNHTRY